MEPAEDDLPWLDLGDAALLAQPGVPSFPHLEVGGEEGGDDGGQLCSPGQTDQLLSGVQLMESDGRQPPPAALATAAARPPMPAMLTDLGDIDADPIAYLEAAIEADRPKYESPSAELQAVLEAVAAEEAGPASAQMLPTALPAQVVVAGRGQEEQTLRPAQLLAPLANSNAAGPAAPQAGGGGRARSSPVGVLRGPGSSGGTSPGESMLLVLQPSAAQLAEQDPPLWSLLEEGSESEQGAMDVAAEEAADVAGLGAEGIDLAAEEEGGTILDWDMEGVVNSASSPASSSPSHVLSAASTEASAISNAGSSTTSQPSSPNGSFGPAAQHVPRQPTTAGGGPAKGSRSTGGSGGAAAEMDVEQLRRRAFTLLQPVCSVLLQSRGNPAELAQLLAGLEVLAGELHPVGLSGCLDYLLFPLLLMLDSIAAMRQRAGGEGADAGPAPAALPAMASDQAAEAALSCLHTGLLHCGGCQHGEQLLDLLHHLAPLVMLPHNRASEEVRLKALRCVAATLQLPEEGAASVASSALREEESAPLVGHLASILLQSAEGEVAAGQGGSRGVRLAALGALRQLLVAVGSAEALAFFLPGLVTGLGKALLVAGGACGTRAKSGAAASSAAAVEALAALTQVLVITLGDESTRHAWEGRQRGSPPGPGREGVGAKEVDATGAGLSSWGANSMWGGTGMLEIGAGAALEQLRQLSLRAAAPAPHSWQAPGSKDSDDAPAPLTPQLPASAAPTEQRGGPPRLRVSLDWAWVEGSSARVQQVLGVALPPLCSHPKPAVRQKLAESCAELLSRCTLSMASCSALLSEVLFTLAQDDWPQVAQAARSWLQRSALPCGRSSGKGPQPKGIPRAAPLAPEAVGSSLLRLAEGLPDALRSGDRVGMLHARKLTTAIQVCQPAWFAAHVLGRPSHLSTLLTALAESFEFDSAAAKLLARAPPEPGTAYLSGKPLAATALPRQPLVHLAAVADGAGKGEARAEEAGSSSSGSGEGAGGAGAMGAGAMAAAAAMQAGASAEAVVLPRMPVGLAIIQTSEAYQAVAGACRAAAAAATAAAAAGGGEGGTGQPSSAGSTALRRLLGHGTQELVRILGEEGASARQGSRAAASKRGAAGDMEHRVHTEGFAPAAALDQPQAAWQLRAAAVMAALSEMVFGASPACQGWQQTSEQHQGEETVHPPAAAPYAASQELESLVLGFLEVVVGGPLWALPTWQLGSGGAAGGEAGPGAHPLSAGQLGVNVLAVRVAVEAVGTCARSMGQRFVHNGRLLRTVLLPLLERLGDPAPLVASAAGAAVGSLCLHCGYGSLNRLVADNADYVVDGVCAQLRQPDRNPRAPYLLAALMHKAGVAPELLPLLAEPARSAVQGVSILARRRAPGHVLPFLLALSEIMQGAGACAEVALRETSQVAERMQAQWQEWQEAVQHAEQAAEHDGDTGTERVRQYFMQRQQERQRREAVGPGMENLAEGEGEGEGRVDLGEEERALLLLRKRRVHGAASLAQTTVDCCGPLVLSSSLQVASHALRVCLAGLRCLRVTTLSLELVEQQVEPFMRRPKGEVTPPDPLTPKLLPSVHLMWSPLMGALKDWRVPLLEAALGALVELAALTGSFLTRRFGQECWPALQRLLREGPTGRRIIAPGQDDLTSPAAVQRVRCAVLSCLHSMASDPGLGPAVAGSSGGGSEVVAPLAGAMLPVVAEWLGDKQAGVVREQATQAFMALARLDSDTAWMLLTLALRSRPGSSARPAAGAPQRCPNPALFPSWDKLRPDSPAVEGIVTAGLRECGAGRLAAMLAQVEKMGARWHRS